MPRSSSLLLAAAIAVVALISFGARQVLRSSYEADVAQRLQVARASTSGVLQTLVDFQSGRVGEGDARQQIGDLATRGRDAVAPLSDAPRLRGSALDPQDTAAGLAAVELNRDFGLLLDAADQGYATTHAAYEAVRLARGAASNPPSPADQQALRQARGVWVRAYAGDLTRVDAGLQPVVEDFSRWRQQDLATAGQNGEWQAVQDRLAQVRQAAETTRDEVESLPVPPGAADAVDHYNAAQAKLTAALDALGGWADARGEPAQLLQAGDDALAAYRSERDQALAALGKLSPSAAG